MPINFNTAYEKGTRSMDGKPGPKYWHNRADEMQFRSITVNGKALGEEAMATLDRSSTSGDQKLTYKHFTLPY